MQYLWNRRMKGMKNSNKWHQSRRFNVLKNCGVKNNKPWNGRLWLRKSSYGDDFWNQRRREVLSGLDELYLYNSHVKPRKKPLGTEKSKKMKRSRCYVCLRRGHAYWNCPVKDRRSDFKRKSKAAVVGKTETVGLQGDQALKLEKVHSKLNWLVLGTEYEGWDMMWYVTDDVPRHMTPHQHVFNKFRLENVGTSTQSDYMIHGIGDIILKTDTRSYVIPSVCYVPNVTLNLLSMNQLLMQGFQVEKKGDNCVVKRLFDDSNPESSSRTVSKDKHGSSEGLESLEKARQEATEAIMKFSDSLYTKECTIEERLEGKQEPEGPSKFEFDSLINFMDLICTWDILPECKEVVKNHFEKLVVWFYKHYLETTERKVPVRLYGTKICLLDLFLTVRGMGGFARVTIKGKWIEVAHAMGFPKEYANGMEECYSQYLSLLDAYYDIGKDLPEKKVVPRDEGREPRDEGTSTRSAGASRMPEEEARKGYEEYREGMLRNRKMKGKIEDVDDDNLIITFEETSAEETSAEDTSEEDPSEDSQEGNAAADVNDDQEIIIVE